MASENRPTSSAAIASNRMTSAPTNKTNASGQPSVRNASGSSMSSFVGLWALFSGMLGAMASCFAKFAFHTSSTSFSSSQGTEESIIQDPWYLTQQYVNLFSYYCDRHILNDVAVADDVVATTAYAAVVHRYACIAILDYVPRGVCLICMIGCNALMLGTFVAGMEESGSVAGTALASAANFACSALFGYWLWHERFPTLWFVGFAMVVLGVMLLSSVQLDSRAEEKEKTTKQKDSKQE